MLLKIKDLISFIGFSFINLIVFPEKKISSKSLLLIRLDAIGDYVLFRNFIEELKKSEKYGQYKITLLGNIAWKDLAEQLDKEYVDRFIWLDRKKFHRNPVYRYKKLKDITSTGYEVAISPAYSREFNFTDNINKLVTANEKIASIGDLSNIRPWQKRISDRYYTRLIPAKDELIFEFYRNKEFFENLLVKKIAVRKPCIGNVPKTSSFALPDNYSILFIGASSSYRKWPLASFARVAQHLKKEYSHKIVVCGGSSDQQDIPLFRKHYGNDFTDLVGKTSIMDILYVIYNGNLMIANETSAGHLAVALGMTSVLVIYNGNHFGRFTPYPHEMTDKYHYIYHPDIEKDLGEYKRLSNIFGYSSKLDIDEISPATVISRIDKIMNNFSQGKSGPGV